MARFERYEGGRTIDHPDDIFDALADERRRRLLVELFHEDSYHVAEPSGVARKMAEADDQLLRQYLSGGREFQDGKWELLRLHRVHLPMLEDYGFVVWDREAHVVTRGSRFQDLRPVLELLADERDVLPSIQS